MRKKYLAASIYLAMSAASSYAIECPGDGQSVVILTPQDLQDAANCVDTVNRTFLLGTNIDLQGFSFKSFGTFSGTFDGQQYIIKNLTPTNGGGLFDNINGSAIIKNLTLYNPTIHSDSPDYGYGALANTMGGQSLITNVNIKAGNLTITGNAPQYNGGIVGVQLSGTIQYSTSSIVMNLFDGNDASSNGGMVGYQLGGTIKFAYTSALLMLGGGRTFANGGVVGKQDKGGLVFATHSSSIISLADGISIGNGVLIGDAEGTIHDVFTDGKISTRGQQSGSSTSGGIVGNLAGILTDSYSNSIVTNPGNINGGVVGYSISGSSCYNSYWNIESGPQTSAVCASGGKTLAQMQTKSTYMGWDFTNTWGFIPNSLPRLLNVP